MRFQFLKVYIVPEIEKLIILGRFWALYLSVLQIALEFFQILVDLQKFKENFARSSLEVLKNVWNISKGNWEGEISIQDPFYIRNVSIEGE